MKVKYFPGCTLRTKAKDLDTYARRSAKILGVELEEIENWQCCGGVFVSAKDEIATKLSSVRLLTEARNADMPLVTVCSACHNVVKQTNHMMRTDSEFADRVNRYNLQEKGNTEYHGEATVLHYLELLRDSVGFDAVKEKTVNPLKGKKIAAYYGCMLLRPHKVMQFDDPENPDMLESLITAIGGDPIRFAMRNECCGAYTVIENKEAAYQKSFNILNNAQALGADLVVTACPLCKYNLEKSGCDLPVYYFTELLAEAFGVKEEQ